MYDVKEIKKKIKSDVLTHYPNHVVRFASDPEAHDIISVELYDVPDCECKSAKDCVWEIIDKNEADGDVMFVPSIFSHTKTRQYYAEYLVCEDFDKELTVKQLELLVKAIDLTADRMQCKAFRFTHDEHFEDYGEPSQRSMLKDLLSEQRDGRDQSDRLAA